MIKSDTLLHTTVLNNSWTIGQYLPELILKNKHLVKETFLNLKTDKQKHIFLTVCRLGSELTDPAAINIKEVAKEAGIAVGSFYKYFENREMMMELVTAVIRMYLLEGTQLLKKWLSPLPLAKALYLYADSCRKWDAEEKDISHFFYKAAYGGSPYLNEKIVQPVAIKNKTVLKELIRNALDRKEFRLNIPLDDAVTLIYIQMAALVDSLMYPQLQSYLFPEGYPTRRIKPLIQTVLSAVTEKKK